MLTIPYLSCDHTVYVGLVPLGIIFIARETQCLLQPTYSLESGVQTAQATLPNKGRLHFVFVIVSSKVVYPVLNQIYPGFSQVLAS